MRIWETGRRTPIGVDLGGASVKAVQLSVGPRKGAGGRRLRTAVRYPRAKAGVAYEAKEIRRLADVLERRGFSGRQIVLLPPQDSVMTEILELPPRSSGAPVEQIARAELSRIHKWEPGSFEMAMWDLPEPARATEVSSVMTAAAPHSAVTPWLDLFEAEGFEVKAIDVHSWALARAGALISESAVEGGPRPDGCVAMVNLGWSAGFLIVMHRGVVVYQRQLPEVGAKPLADAVAKELGLENDAAELLLSRVGVGETVAGAGIDPGLASLARAVIESRVQGLADDVGVSLSYVTHQYGAGGSPRVLVCGRSASMPGLCDGLGRMLGTKPTVCVPRLVVDCSTAEESAEDSGLIPAIGLAMHQQE